MSRRVSLPKQIRIGTHRFSPIDVARVRHGVGRATCRRCTPGARAFAGRAMIHAAPGCPDCAASRARLEILRAHLEKGGLL